jgi:uncharacterized membrane protein
MSAVFLFLAAFVASAVEMVEALTIVLAVGVTRGWRSTFYGVAAAAAALALVIAALGPALQQVPIDALRLLVGFLLLAFGLQWLRKAILRASGFKALHDEDEIFGRERQEAGQARRDVRWGLDWYSFVLSFKGVFLEGLEVAFIVITLGANQGATAVAAAGAVAAFLVVVAAGAAVRHPLSRVPENTLKLVVGVMLTSFGTFWAGEGVGIDWPGSDAALAALVLLTAAWSWAFIRLLSRRPQAVTA